MVPSQHRIQGLEPSNTVTIETSDRVTLSRLIAQAPSIESIERNISFDCLSGRAIEGTWKGFPFIPLLETAGIPGDTTHFTLESADGQRACISVHEAQDGLLALERDSESLDAPRFVAQDILGPRAVKDIRIIMAVSLEPGESREDLETVTALQDDSG